MQVPYDPWDPEVNRTIAEREGWCLTSCDNTEPGYCSKTIIADDDVGIFTGPKRNLDAWCFVVLKARTSVYHSRAVCRCL